MEVSFLKQHPLLKDIVGLIIFAGCVLLGTIFINSFVFRSFNVEGPSMETTLYTGDRLIVDRLPVTWDQLQGKKYVPPRGQIIVFRNPLYVGGFAGNEEFIVKRVIAFGGERVKLSGGQYMVYNSQHPQGFNPDDANHGEPGSPTAGELDRKVPDGTLFVSGDHRQLDPSGNPYSLDSRNGLGNIPLNNVIGPVSLRIFPFQKIRTF